MSSPALYGSGFQNCACAWSNQGIYAEVAVSPSMMATTAEADTLKAFIPDLVTAICDCVQPVSDQCLAKGLISETTHRQVLESRGTSNEQARTLILSVQISTKTDGGCFEVFLDTLNDILPYRVKEKLLSVMRKDLTDRAAMRKSVIPASQSTRFMLEDDHLQCIKQQGFLFGKYESSMKKYAHASAEKTSCEESLQNKTKESGRLRSSLEVLKIQSSGNNSQEIDSTVERLSACETEMSELKERIEKLEGVLQEEDMQARRGKSKIMVGTKRFARMTQEQFTAVLKEKEEEHKRSLKEKDEEYKRSLKEKEDELRRRMQEEIDVKMKDHMIALRESQLQVKELELKLKYETESRHLVPDGAEHERKHRVYHRFDSSPLFEGKHCKYTV